MRLPIFCLVILSFFTVAGCSGWTLLGNKKSTFDRSLKERYEINVNLNPEGKCGLLMFEDIWSLVRHDFFRPVTDRQLFAGAVKGLAGALEKEVKAPKYKKNKSYSVKNFWSILIKYKEQSRGNLSELCYASIEGMLKGLNDPHTRLVRAKRGAIEVNRVSGSSYVGLGYWFRIFVKPQRIFIEAVFDNSPAEKAGLKKYDEILEINNEKVKHIRIMDFIHKTRGKAGTEVVLKVKRRGWKHPKKFRIARAAVSANASCKMLGEITYCKLFNFSKKVYADLEASFNQLPLTKNKKLIIDVRTNLGGAMDSVISVLRHGWFKKKFIALILLKKGKFSPVPISGGKGLFSGYKTVVLTNPLSASASEIFVAVLKEHGKAVIIGQRTYGKGLIQGMKFSYGAVLYFSHMEYLTPHGDIVQKYNSSFSIFNKKKSVKKTKVSSLQTYLRPLKRAKSSLERSGRRAIAKIVPAYASKILKEPIRNGIRPDIEAPLDISDIEQGRDLQLETAIKYLKENK